MASNNIIIGSLTVSRNPMSMTVIKKERITATVDTYAGIEFFSWGSSIVGKEINLYWPIMSYSDFNDIQTMIEGEAPVIFNPQRIDGKTYNVELITLDGEYFNSGSNPESDEGVRRREVRLGLLILSEAT